jgi:tetratricopeptide (TPR) repeat protein
MAVFLLIVLVWPVHAQSQMATVHEEQRTLTTYPYSDPDPIPILTRNPVLYPYFAFDGYTDRAKDQTWKVVCLENEYIRAYILPQVGGKIFGAVEKSTGREFVYMNDVLKFRRIALRGPWTSGGIEFNFGVVGHAPSTASPVDYLLRRNSDGSATCFVGTLDLPSRTRWTVAITLPKERAYLETRAYWYNPTPYLQSYYSWSTAAVSARQDLHYSYPGTMVVQHSTTTGNGRWPIDEKGRDVSWYRNNNFEGSKSYFVFGQYADHFGAIAQDEKFGLGHWALYDDMPGRKVWLWSLFRDGGIWEKLLTDTRGQYSEPQAGRLLSQVDHEFFPPYTGDTWRELWFPVKDVGGISAASPHAVLNVVRSRDSVTINICALQQIHEALVASSEGREELKAAVRMKPMEFRSFALRTPSGHLKVTLGGNKLVYDENPASRELKRPIQYQRPAENSPEGLYLAGEALEKERQYESSLERYLACIDAEPNHLRALVHIAGLYGRRGEYAKGLDYATRALQLSKFNPEANYAYGILSRALEHFVEAKETFGWAARSLEFRSNAYCQIAEICITEGDFDQAVDYARKSIEYNAYNSNGYLAKAIALRKLRNEKDARTALTSLLQFDPLNHQACFEECLMAGSAQAWTSFTNGITTELAFETYLEMAAAYATMNLHKEALTLLSYPMKNPMASYWRAFLCRESSPQICRENLDDASTLSPEFVFPFREEEIQVLKWVIAQRPSDWKPRYYLALLYWGKGRKREALDLFDECRDPQFATFYVSRALLKKELKKEGVRTDLETALHMDRTAWRNWHHLIVYLQQSGNYDQALAIAGDARKMFADQIALQMDYATALYDKEKYSDCLEILGRINVLPYEGSWEAHDLYVRANLRKGMEELTQEKYERAIAALRASMEFPEHLGTGKPYEPDYRVQDYLLFLSYSRLGRMDSATAALQRAGAYTKKNRLEWGSDHLFGLLALERLGDEDAMRQIVSEWQTKNSDDPLLRWWLAMRRGDTVAAKEIEARFRNDSRTSLKFAAATM